jgi:hypothetical protein
METILFGNKQIDFFINYTNRKTLGITVKPDMSIHVKAPIDSSLEKIKEKMIKRAPWIIRQQYFFLSFLPKNTSRKYIAGESHLYLGRQYRLKLNIDTLCKDEFVKLKGQFFEINTNNKERVKELLLNWYLEKAKQQFNQLALPIFEKFVLKHNLFLSKYDLSLRNMPTRWGSCTSKGRIILNPELIKAPKGCIEYVIIHELCHLIHHDHTQKFMDLQTKEMPDWEKWKMKLERLLA